MRPAQIGRCFCSITRVQTRPQYRQRQPLGCSCNRQCPELIRQESGGYRISVSQSQCQRRPRRSSAQQPSLGLVQRGSVQPPGCRLHQREQGTRNKCGGVMSTVPSNRQRISHRQHSKYLSPSRETAVKHLEQRKCGTPGSSTLTTSPQYDEYQLRLLPNRARSC